MAGFFDDIFSQSTKTPFTRGERLASHLPLGIFGAYAHRHFREKKMQEELEKAAAPKSAVGERMLSRAREEGFDSIPAMLAAKQYSKQAEANPNNVGNAMMNTSNWLAANGYTDQAAALGVFAHKNVQTPWKPSEAGTDVENFKLSDGTVVAAESPEQKRALIKGGAIKAGVASGDPEVPWVTKTGAELGYQHPQLAGDLFKVKYNKDGTIKDISSLSGMSVSVGGTSINTPGDISQTIRDYQGAIATTQQSVGVLDNLYKTLEQNPGGGVSGLSGVVTSFVGSLTNLAEFAISADDKKIGEKYEKSFMGMARKYFPTGSQATAEAQIVELAYALARINNMGTSGGGRGITDADMQYALKQLGSMSNVEDFKGVLQYQRNKMLSNLKIARAGTEAILEINKMDKGLLAPLNSLADPLMQGSDKKKYAVGEIVTHGNKRYKVVGGDPYDPDLEEVP